MLEYIVLGYVLQAQNQEGSKEIFLFNLKISGIILCLWSLVENLESIRIAGQILFAMDMAARKIINMSGLNKMLGQTGSPILCWLYP